MTVRPPGGPAPARRATHQPWYARSPLPTRGRPGTAQGLHLAVLLDLRAMEDPASSPPTTLESAGGRGVAPPPDIPRTSHREFGHRVGVFRLLRELTRRDIPTAAVVDVLTAEHYPAVMDAVNEGAQEVLAGGLSAGRAITSDLDRPTEERLVADSLERLTAALPARPRGWFGPERGESASTPEVLARAGLDYVADWAMDEQPVPLTGAGGLWAVPVSWELSDLATVFHRQMLPWVYARSTLEAIERLRAEAREQPRCLVLHWHPWLVGQAFRMRSLTGLLDRVASLDGVRLTTPGAVLDAWRPQEGPTRQVP